ncbi:hypothetical protein DSM107007_33460 [Nostoc sp. PCC 7120 = FACHB-418]|nr:hypothetical protein DSM107007_33460 [Nostoc sp. PCC 7120 = FACHB-418]
MCYRKNSRITPTGDAQKVVEYVLVTDQKIDKNENFGCDSCTNFFFADDWVYSYLSLSQQCDDTFSVNP